MIIICLFLSMSNNLEIVGAVLWAAVILSIARVNFEMTLFKELGKKNWLIGWEQPGVNGPIKKILSPNSPWLSGPQHESKKGPWLATWVFLSIQAVYLVLFPIVVILRRGVFNFAKQVQENFPSVIYAVGWLTSIVICLGLAAVFLRMSCNVIFWTIAAIRGMIDDD